jgi:hypothetical protein
MFAYTHASTHVRLQTRMFARTQTNTDERKKERLHALQLTFTNVCTHALKHAGMHKWILDARTHACTEADFRVIAIGNKDACTHESTYARLNVQTLVRTHASTQVSFQLSTLARKHAYACRHARFYARKRRLRCTHSLTQNLVRTHALAQKCSHACWHAKTLACMLEPTNGCHNARKHALAPLRTHNCTYHLSIQTRNLACTQH